MQLEYRNTGNLQTLRSFSAKENTLTLLTPVRNYRVKVSAVIITFNEEHRIRKTLSKLQWCDEILIIDSGSSDRTIEICKDYGCVVETKAFEGFGRQKQYGVTKAKHDWILCVDADEVLTNKLIEELKEELSAKMITDTAFAIPRNLVFMNRVFLHGKESNASIIRLFNRQFGSWDKAEVHEKIITQGPVKVLKHKMLHYSHQSYSHFLSKIDLYSTLGAQKQQNKKKSKSNFVMALSLPFNFFKYYVLDRNFMNGYHGFVWAVMNTMYHFIKYLKLKELGSQQQEQP
jgi:glycosyltransferase involved in cell wall biosynthesis